MKTINTLLLSLFFVTGLMAQQKDIYGNFTKSNDAKIKGTSVAIGYENQVIISSYTGGSDNNGIIEIEVPSGAYVADFRNLMNTQTVASANKPVIGTSIKTTVKPTTVNTGINKTQLIQQPVTLKGFDIAVATLRKDQKSHSINSKIILQDITVQSVTDDMATGSSKIKLKANRIGWIYYTYEPNGKISGSSKSGWDNAAGKAWTDF